jgi:hypothetical protein
MLNNKQEKELETRLNALAYEAEENFWCIRKESYEQALEVLWDIQRQNIKPKKKNTKNVLCRCSGSSGCQYDSSTKKNRWKS